MPGSDIGLGALTLLLGGTGLGVSAAILFVALLAIRRRRNTADSYCHDNNVKQLELSHGDQQRYVVAYQLKPESKQPDILSRSKYSINKLSK